MTRKEARRLTKGEFVQRPERDCSDRVLAIGYMAEPPDGVEVAFKPVDGSAPYVEEFLDPTTYVEMGWGVCVGLPVSVSADAQGNITAHVDWSELDMAVAEQVTDPAIIRAVDLWLEHHLILPVAYPKGASDRPVERCTCGAPIAKWYDPELDGDVTPRSDCLTVGCLASTT